MNENEPAYFQSFELETSTFDMPPKFDEATRDERVQFTLLGQEASALVSVRLDLRCLVSFRIFAREFSSPIYEFGAAGTPKFWSAFHAFYRSRRLLLLTSDADFGQKFGANDEQNLCHSESTRTQREEAVLQAVRDVLTTIAKIIETNQGRTLEYATWFMNFNEAPAPSIYQDMIAKVAARLIIDNMVLSEPTQFDPIYPQ